MLSIALLLLLGGSVPSPQDDSALLDPVAASVTTARAAYAEGDLDAARNELARALGLAPDEPSVRLWLARVLNDLGRSAEALEVLEPALAALPRSAWLLVEAGRADRSLGRRQEAELAFRAALEAYPELGSARLEWAELLLEEGAERAAEALELLEPLADRRPRPTPVVLRETEALTLLGRDAEGESLLRDEIDRPPVRLALCRWLAEHGRAPEAWEVGEPLVASEVEPAARTLLAQVAHRAGESLVALELLGAVLLDDPTHATALAELGEVLEEAPDLLAGVVARRVAARPRDADAWRELFEACLRDGRVAELLQRYDELPAALRSDPGLVLARGRALRRAGRTEEAREVLEPLCAADDARACYEIGLLDYAAGRYEVAAGEFERAVAGDQAADARFNRGVCLDRLGRYAGAADEYAAAVAARPDFAEAWLQLGHDCRLRLGQPDRARDAYRSYLDLGGDDPEVRRYLASEER